jgi:hypothetical protein
MNSMANRDVAQEVTGVVFRTCPATRAAYRDPAEALKHE